MTTFITFFMTSRVCKELEFLKKMSNPGYSTIPGFKLRWIHRDNTDGHTILQNWDMYVVSTWVAWLGLYLKLAWHQIRVRGLAVATWLAVNVHRIKIPPLQKKGTVWPENRFDNSNAVNPHKIYFFILTQHVCRGCTVYRGVSHEVQIESAASSEGPQSIRFCVWKKLGPPKPWTAPAPPRSERGRRGRPGPRWRFLASTQPSACRLERQD
jgi:hypothetical protein